MQESIRTYRLWVYFWDILSRSAGPRRAQQKPCDDNNFQIKPFKCLKDLLIHYPELSPPRRHLGHNPTPRGRRGTRISGNESYKSPAAFPTLQDLKILAKY